MVTAAAVPALALLAVAINAIMGMSGGRSLAFSNQIQLQSVNNLQSLNRETDAESNLEWCRFGRER